MEIKGLYQLKMLGKSLWQQFDLFSQKKKKKKSLGNKKKRRHKRTFYSQEFPQARGVSACLTYKSFP